MKKIFVLFVLSLILSFSLIANEGKSFIEVKIKGEQDVQKIKSMNLDVAGINRNENLVGIIANSEQIDELKRNGFEVFIKKASPTPEDASLDLYYTPAEMEAIINQIAESHPDICKVEKISDELFDGNYLYAVKITKDVSTPNDRPSFILDAQHHAREVMTSQISVDMIDYLTSNYGTDPDVTNWVDNINIIVIPMVNPDGINYVFTNDRWWRKNRNPNCPVDLNRNYNFNWGLCNGSSDWCYDETYRGTSPDSEPETKSMDRIMAENPAIYALTYHSYGEYILYPLGCYDPSDNQAYWEFASGLNSILENDQGKTGMYATGAGWSTIYLTDGSSDDHHYGRYGTFSVCIEVNSTGFQPDYTQWRDITVQRQRTAWKYFLNKTIDSPRIEGHIKDASTGLPIKARVDVEEVPFIHNEFPRYASEKGFYFRPLPQNSTFNVTFSSPGYCSETRTVNIGTSKVVVNVDLTPSGNAPVSNPIPSDKAINQKLTLQLSWQGSSSNYLLYFGETTNPPLLTSTNATTYTLSNLEYGKTYYWRVDTEGGCGSSTGELWSFSTYKYGISSVTALKDPFRLSIIGDNFSYDATVKVNGNVVPQVSHKGSTKIVAKGGKTLKNMVPKGSPVLITVEDSQGGTSEPFTFTR
jgi:hypothetical protein